MEFLGDLRRTKMCGQFSKEDIDKEVVAMGFVAKERNLGTLIFVDLRDRSGIVQISFEQKNDADELFEKATKIRNEYVIAVTGTVKSRGEKNINKNISTGEIEIIASSLKILNVAEVPPFVVSELQNVSESLRMKYRYLDLRKASLQEKLIIKSRAMKIVRDYMDGFGFLEIETPFLGRSTPEGARDYLVPSRVHKGEFYALPQSPQQYKQLLMISGFDRYYQIARCFRDEDLRANRQPEFSQIDIEMSFADADDLMVICEGLIRKLFKEIKNYDVPEKLPRLVYQEAMERFGSDKPDTRFGLELKNISDIASKCELSLFRDACKSGSVRAINAKGLAPALTRKTIDKLGEFVKDYGAKGLAYMLFKEEGITSSVMKFFNDEQINEIKKRLDVETGDAVFIVADKVDKAVFASLGALRLKLAKDNNLIPENTYNMLWVTDFPLFEYDEEEQRYIAIHHPFTSPVDEDVPLLDTEPIKVRSKAYDFVINGEEAGGGSVRIHRADMQKKVFGLLGMSDEDIVNKFGYFVEAFRYGAPPHLGLAFGLDRLIMLLTNTESIKDVIAFPKMQNAACLMTDAPSEVEPKQLKELSLQIKE